MAITEMKISIRPSEKKTQETVSAPPSKSMSHRLLIAAAMAEGISTVRNAAMSDDVAATMDCLKSLGAKIECTGPETDCTIRVGGTDPRASKGTVLTCRESGSTLRFLIPVAALSGNEMVFTGSKRLMERPLSVYEKLFSEKGLSIKRTDELSLMIGGRLESGIYEADGSISSQFISGLLMALPLTGENSVIRLTSAAVSRPYIDMTIESLKTAGVLIERQSETELIVPGCQKYKAFDAETEGDWSNAAYLIAAGAGVTGLSDSSIQGDRVCVEYFHRLRNAAAQIDISDCPDLAPVLMAYAAMNHGCMLTGTKRLKYKESDRGSCMGEELAKFGIMTSIKDNMITVDNGLRPPSEMLCGHNDHRIVMALAALCARTGGIIDGAEAVNKSFPDYFTKLERSGRAEVREVK